MEQFIKNGVQLYAMLDRGIIDSLDRFYIGLLDHETGKIYVPYERLYFGDYVEDRKIKCYLRMIGFPNHIIDTITWYPKIH